ncbi:MAG: Ig-like domain-containing protein, partial [Casimicrobium sp.]
VMGAASTAHFHAGAKRQLEYLGDPTITQGVASIERSGDYDLLPYSTNAPGLKAISIRRFGNGDRTYSDAQSRLHVEYRQALGYDGNLGTKAGNKVQISVGNNHFLDLNPSTTSYDDGALPLNASFDEPQSGTRLTLIAASAQKATVRVELDPCGRTLPLVRVVDASPYALIGQQKRLHVWVTNLDSPARCTKATELRLSIDKYGSDAPPPHSVIGSHMRTIPPGTSAKYELDMTTSSKFQYFYVNVHNSARPRYAQRVTSSIVGIDFALSLIAGDLQSTSVSRAFTTPLRVRATDATGAPVSGVRVGFVAATGFVTVGSCDTGLNGECAVTATAKNIPGSYVVQATAGRARSLDFRLTNTSATAPALDPQPLPFNLGTLVGVGLAVPHVSSTVSVNGI